MALKDLSSSDLNESEVGTSWSGSADLSEAFIGLRVLFALSLDANFHRHALECACHPDETAGHGHDLPDVARNGDRD